MEYTIITGATSGIGSELASIYAKNGHNLILIARRKEVLEELKTKLEALNQVEIKCFSCDLSNQGEINQLFTMINTNYQIKCLINNAGVGIFDTIENIKLEDLNYQTNLNFIAPILITTNLIANISRNKGSIINICSILSYLPNHKKSVYVGNKHALLGFSNSIRIEYPNVHCLTVHPATVRTNFFTADYYQNKKVLTPKVVAAKTFKAYLKRKRKIDIPKGMIFIRVLYALFPKLVDWLNNKYFS